MKKLVFAEIFTILFMEAYMLLTLESDWFYFIQKSIASLICLSLGFICHKRFPQNKLTTIMLFALLFCFIGDLLLGYKSVAGSRLSFLLGIGAFAIAQILFSAAFFCKSKLHILGVATTSSLTLFIAAIFIFVDNTADPSLLPGYIAYAFIINTAVGQGLSLFQEHRQEAFSRWILLGIVLFWISDMVLLVTLFLLPNRELSSPLNHPIYFTALLCLVRGVYLQGKIEK